MTSKRRTPAWKQFEQAVASFIAALDPTARVSPDHLLPDRDTGKPRQRDVLIDGKLAGHFSVRALVSCKHYARRLNQLDVDHFVGELRSSNAQLGIIYSASGFSSNALEKARALGIHCCRLYRNEPAELPESLGFKSFCFTPYLVLGYDGTPLPAGTRWRELFDLPASEDGTSVLREAIAGAYRRLEAAALARLPADPGLHKQTDRATVSYSSPHTSFVVHVLLSWNVFEGRVNAHLVNGSYCETSGDFVGRVSGPFIDMRGPEPGPGWKRVKQPSHGPDEAVVQAYLYGGDLTSALDVLAERAVKTDGAAG